jgi:hypothetical protein
MVLISKSNIFLFVAPILHIVFEGLKAVGNYFYGLYTILVFFSNDNLQASKIVRFFCF